MGDKTKIEWCDKTFNPWWGCTKVSPACDHCYAESMAKRTGNAVWGKDAPRRFFGDAHWDEPLKWDRQAAGLGVRYRVFCASMADVMEDRRDLDAPRARLFDLIRQTPHLDWLLLTKRPHNFRRMLPASWLREPQHNVWLMTTVESNKYLWRVEALLDVLAVVHGVSYEPALGPLDLSAYLHDLDWVIAGGESGGGARGADPDWFRDVRGDCATAGVAFLFKQWGEYGPVREPIAETLVSIILTGSEGAPVRTMKRIGKKEAGRLLDGREHNEFPAVVAQ